MESFGLFTIILIFGILLGTMVPWLYFRRKKDLLGNAVSPNPQLLRPEQEFRQKTRILSTSMKALNAYTWFYDTREGILRFGEGFELTGGDAQEMGSMEKFAQKIHPAHRRGFIDFMARFREQESGDFAVEYMIDYVGSGEYQWWECRGVIEVATENNCPYKYIYGIDINITARKQGELSLLETQTKLARLNKQTELILNNTNSGLVFLDKDYVVQWENLSSYIPHQTLDGYKQGTVCYQAMRGLDAPCPGCVVEKSRQTLQRELKEISFGELSGELTATPVFNKGNELIGTVLKIVDITDKQRMDKELQAAKEKAEETNLLMRNIYDQIPCLLFIKDISDDFRYVVANNYFCSSLGKPNEQVVGYTDFEIFPLDEAQKFRTDDLMACELNKPFCFEEETLWQGKQTTWQTTKTVVKAINDHRMLICHSVDITEKIKAYNELQEAKERAEQSNKLKSTFLANMSHEIRTPLNAIVGFSNLMAFSDAEEDKKEYYNIINTNNDLLLRLIGDILDLSKIEAGMLALKPEHFSIAELFEGLHLTFSQRILSKDVALISNVPSDDPCYLYLDKNRFTQVITNFLTNAIKFTPAGQIEMGYAYTKGGVRVYVSDTGIGIEKAKIPKVFERFEKLDDFAQGTGLGMAICKAITDAFGGEIGVESEMGKGSTFWAWFPVKTA